MGVNDPFHFLAGEKFSELERGKENSLILRSGVILIYLFPECLTDGRIQLEDRHCVGVGSQFPPQMAQGGEGGRERKGEEQEIISAALERFPKVRCRQSIHPKQRI